MEALMFKLFNFIAKFTTYHAAGWHVKYFYCRYVMLDSSHTAIVRRHELISPSFPLQIIFKSTQRSVTLYLT